LVITNPYHYHNQQITGHDYSEKIFRNGYKNQGLAGIKRLSRVKLVIILRCDSHSRSGKSTSSIANAANTGIIVLWP
jgi:hypothetical protein